MTFGIDFGTNSCSVVGYIPGQEPFHFGISGDKPYPSIVAINKENGEIYTGEEARNKRIELSETCEYIPSIKTILDQDKEWVVLGKIYTPVDIACELFKALKRNVENRPESYELDEATVAIPIGFNSVKRNVIREAALKAGIAITAFVSEPTAAFFANRKHLRADRNIAVFDWGGGTLDVSLIRHEDGKISEVVTQGLNKAGDLIDLEIAKKIHTTLLETQKNKIEFEKIPSVYRDMLLMRTENAKIALSQKEEEVIRMGKYGDYGTLFQKLNYEDLKKIVNPIVKEAVNVLLKVINDAGLEVYNIDRILLVGGSTGLRPLQEYLSEVLGKDEKILFKPEDTIWCVGEGVAFLSENPGGVYSNQAVELVMSDGTHFRILEPEQKFIENGNLWSRKFYFSITDTTEQVHLVFSGSKDIDEDIDRYRVLDIPAYNFLEERVELRAFIDANMMFYVEAKSTLRSEVYSMRWEYPRLKSYYKLPEEEE